MKVSLITTVLNEESTIEDFLKSIIKQTKKPDEFVIVDGGSGDKTYEILKKYSKKYRWIKVFRKKGTTVGEGRNFAIKKAKNEIIACTDAGCILDKNWLNEITKPFQNNDIDVVVGIYKPYYTNDFEYFQSLIVVPQPEKIFMNASRMSSRSIAFKKSAWKKVNGYPNLTTGEDTEFNIKLIENKFRFTFEKDAVVYWKMRNSWKNFAKQFYKYGIGDRKSGNILKMKKNLLFVFGFWSYILFLISSLLISFRVSLILISIGVFYFFTEGIKLGIKSRSLKGVVYGFLLSLIKRISYFVGVSLGK